MEEGRGEKERREGRGERERQESSIQTIGESRCQFFPHTMKHVSRDCTINMCMFASDV